MADAIHRTISEELLEGEAKLLRNRSGNTAGEAIWSLRMAARDMRDHHIIAVSPELLFELVRYLSGGMIDYILSERGLGLLQSGDINLFGLVSPRSNREPAYRVARIDLKAGTCPAEFYDWSIAIDRLKRGFVRDDLGKLAIVI